MKNSFYKKLVRQYYEELWNKQNKDYIDILFNDDISFRGSLNIEANGKKEFAEYMDKILTAIPNLYHGIEIILFEDNMVVTRAIYNGTHQGELFGYKASNNRIKYNGASFFKFKDDKISSVWVLGDLTTLLGQLGTKNE